MAKHTLITFLGKNSYNSAFYGSTKTRVGKTAHLWHELFIKPDIARKIFPQKQKKEQTPNIDKVIILGTQESNWGDIYQLDKKEKKSTNTSKGNLLKKALDNDDGSDSNEWDEFQKFLKANKWQGNIIATGMNRDEQIQILKTINDLKIEEGSIVSLDVTHGLRHLPMLGIVIALYLQQTRCVQINSIFYGAYDLRTEHKGIAPIIKLEGLLKIAEWIGALKTFEKDGNYAVFAELLKEDGFTDKATKDLKKAAFTELALHLSTDQGAIKHLRATYDFLEEKKNLQGISGLFKDNLQKHLVWCKQDDLYEQQKALACAYLKRDNYAQATILAVEATITKNCEKEEYIHNHIQRDRVLSILSDVDGVSKKKKEERQKRQALRELKTLRNHFAHATTESEEEAIVTTKKRDSPQERVEKKKQSKQEQIGYFKSEEAFKQYIKEEVEQELEKEAKKEKKDKRREERKEREKKEAMENFESEDTLRKYIKDRFDKLGIS